jgi:hypothetical protein
MKTNCNFSVTHYKSILDTALTSGYRFGKYDELENEQDFICVLRHDVDYTPERAAIFGQIEKDLGIKAYYFFLINSEIYNLRDHRVYKVINELKEMGHYIGLHYDLSWNSEIKWEDVPKQCIQEKNIFKALTDIEPCNIVSFHNPHIFTDLLLNKDVEGLEHTYEKRYFSDTKYLSDSQGWYEGCMCGVFSKKTYKKIQLLTHPYIWPEEVKSSFTEDMAEMIKVKKNYIVDYMIKYHPVCTKNKEKLRRLTEIK